MTRQPVFARRAEALLDSAVIATAPVAGGDIATATKLRLSDGTTALMKTHPRPPEGFFAAEMRGLRWLGAVEAGVPVPEVLAGDDECVILRWVEQGKPGAEAATDAPASVVDPSTTDRMSQRPSGRCCGVNERVWGDAPGAPVVDSSGPLV